METRIQTLERNLETCKKVCDSVHIPYGEVSEIRVNTRAKSFFGRCSYQGNGKYLIEISEMMMKARQKELMNTMLHELLHTCKGCMNHGKLWKSYAQRLNDIGYRVETTSSYEKIGIKRPPKQYRYKVICEGCGYEWKYQKKGSIIRSIENGWGCRCGCGSTRFRVEEI